MLFPDIHKNDIWQEGNQKLASISCKKEIVEILNVRDRDLVNDKISYTNEKLDIENLENIYLYSVPFGFKNLLSHIMLEFTFSDGKNIILSVESRRKENQEFSPLKGLLRQYGLIYVWETWNSGVGVRKKLKKFDIFKYKLKLDIEEKKEGLLYFIDRTNKLINKPEYYNTIINNCTTNLWDAFDLKEKGPKWGLKVVFSGLIDKHLYNLGYINDSKSFKETKGEASL